MRLASSEHAARPWVMSRIAPDFELLDVWALPVEGGCDDFPAVVAMMTSLDPAASDSRVSSLLFGVRQRLGQWFGWDDDTNTLPIPGCTEASLRDRLPDDLRNSAGHGLLTGERYGDAIGFVPVFQTAEEWAAELGNHTVHGVLQLVWVEQSSGRYRAHLGVYVKPRGRSGRAYLAFIAPFRHVIVYPALLRQVGRAWEARVR